MKYDSTFIRYFKFIFLIVFTLFWVSCGSGSGTSSSTTSGISLNSNLSVIDAQASSSSSLIRSLGLADVLWLAVSDLPGDSDYFNDSVNRWVYDSSLAPLDLINEILCSIDQTAHDQMVNQGPYIAQIDFALCNKDKDQSSQEGNESSGDGSATDFEYWTVDVTRASASASVIMKVFIPYAGDDSGETSSSSSETNSLLLAKMTIESGPTATNPNGVFHIDLKESPLGDSVGPTMVGFLGSSFNSTDNTNKVQMHIQESGSEFSFESAATVVKDADVDGLTAVLSESFSGGSFGSDSKQYKVAANSSFVKTASNENDSTSSSCKSRDDFDTYVYRYNLYHDTLGSRIDLDNPGFPVSYTNSSGDARYCYASYWGLWCDKDEYPSNGTSLTREDSSGTYTYFVEEIFV